MSNEHNIVPLTFPVSGEKVRVVHIDGEPWFVAVDVCRELGIAKPRNAVASLDEGDAHTTGVIDGLGREQETHVINEAGLYQLIFQSRKAEAKRFKRWIFEEVIPTIRRTGSYESMEAKEAKVLEILEASDEAYRKIEVAKFNGEIPGWVAQAFADANGILTEAMGFPAILTTSGEIDDDNGVGTNKGVRFNNGRQRSMMYKKATGRLPFKAPTFRRGQFRIVNQFPRTQAKAIDGFYDKRPKAIDK